MLLEAPHIAIDVRHRAGDIPATAPQPNALANYLRRQMVNARRHAATVRHFRREDYGEGPEAPKEPNVRAVNGLLALVQKGERAAEARLRDLGTAALRRPETALLAAFAEAKDRTERRIRLSERIWDFYDGLFAQRVGPFADRLLGIDRIALDCYQACYMGLGRARSIPTPPPMAYIEAGQGPATYRRGVPLSRLGKRANPFPLVRIPYHRLMNPWSLGAVPHEIGHNLQSDLSLWQVVPRQIEARLSGRKIPQAAIAVWKRWHKEIYADLIGVLLTGPAYVASLMDVIGTSPARITGFSALGVHPTRYYRLFINTELLRRIGFVEEARDFDAAWHRLYPKALAFRLPKPLKDSFDAAMTEVVDVIAFAPHAAYGGKALTQVVRFRHQDAATVQEAARRLASNTNPGILPERFFICAAREALERRLATPEQIEKSFYNALNGR